MTISVQELGKISYFHLAQRIFRGFTTCIEAQGKAKWMWYNARPISSLENPPRAGTAYDTTLGALVVSLGFVSYSWHIVLYVLITTGVLSPTTYSISPTHSTIRTHRHRGILIFAFTVGKRSCLITDHERVFACWLKPKEKSKRGKRNERDQANPSIRERNPNKHAFSMRQQISALISTTEQLPTFLIYIFYLCFRHASYTCNTSKCRGTFSDVQVRNRFWTSDLFLSLRLNLRKRRVTIIVATALEKMLYFPNI